MLAFAIAGPVLVSYAALVVLGALLTTTAGADWSLAGGLRVAAPLWLAVHQVPLTITAPGGSAAPLGVLPLLPTIGLAVLVARAARRAATRLGWYTPTRVGALGAAFAAGHAALGLAIALTAPATGLAVTPGSAVFGCAAIAGLSAAAGAVCAVGLPDLASGRLPPWAVRGVQAGGAALTSLIATGALCTFGGLAFSAGAAHDLLAGWDQSGAPGGELGVTLLSLAYLPNAVVAALSWTAGPGLSVGAVSVTPFGTTAGSLPAIPLLAALPEPGPAPWRVMVLALPVLAGVLVGRSCRGTLDDVTDRLHATVTAGAVAAAGCFALSILAGGRLGGGQFDPVRIPSASLAVAVFVWVVLPSGMIVALTDRSTRRPSTGILADPTDNLDQPNPTSFGEPNPGESGLDESSSSDDSSLDGPGSGDPGSGGPGSGDPGSGDWGPGGPGPGGSALGGSGSGGSGSGGSGSGGSGVAVESAGQPASDADGSASGAG